MDEKTKKIFYGLVIIVFVFFALIFISNLFTPWYYPTDDLSDKPENLVNSMSASIFQEKASDRINFLKKDSIDVDVISKATSLEKEQICLGVSDSLKERGFELKENSLISYSGESPVEVKLAGLCAFQDNFADGSFLDYSPILEEKGFALNESCCIEVKKCCVLFLFEADE